MDTASTSKQPLYNVGENADIREHVVNVPSNAGRNYQELKTCKYTLNLGKNPLPYIV